MVVTNSRYGKYRVGIKVALCNGQWSESESEKRSQIYFEILQNLSSTLLVSCPWSLFWCLGFCDDLEIRNISISDLTCCICQILTCVFVRYCCVYLSNIFMCISMIFSCVFLWFKMRLPDTIARRQEGLCLAAISRSQILHVVFVRYFHVYFSDTFMCISQIFPGAFLRYSHVNFSDSRCLTCLTRSPEGRKGFAWRQYRSRGKHCAHCNITQGAPDMR